MKRIPGFGFTFLLAVLLAGALVYWLHTGYQRERHVHKQALMVRGETLLDSIEAGIRSQRRMGRWFFENIETILSETALTPGVREIAIYDNKRNLLGRGGEKSIIQPPGENLAPSLHAWQPEGLLILRQTRIAAEPAGGLGGWGRGADRGGNRSIQAELQYEALSKKPIWLAILLHREDFDRNTALAKQRFFITTTASLLALFLGLALVTVVQRQFRLRAELDFSLERERRLAERSQLGAGLAHETKNPLSLIRGLAQTLVGTTRKSLPHDELSDQCAQHGQSIVDEVDRVVGRINSFLEFSRAQSPRLETVRLDKILSETVSLFQDEAAAKGIRLEVEASSVTILADAEMLRQVLVNLLANALAVCKSGNTIWTRIERQTRHARLLVEDDGPGIEAEDLPRLTTPYFTRRPGGVGLGLAIVDQIVQSHRWRLDIQSRPCEGSCFIINEMPVEKDMEGTEGAQ